jgi:hypothetical protein
MLNEQKFSKIKYASLEQDAGGNPSFVHQTDRETPASTSLNPHQQSFLKTILPEYMFLKKLMIPFFKS